MKGQSIQHTQTHCSLRATTTTRQLYFELRSGLVLLMSP